MQFAVFIHCYDNMITIDFMTFMLFGLKTYPERGKSKFWDFFHRVSPADLFRRRPKSPSFWSKSAVFPNIICTNGIFLHVNPRNVLNR